MFETFRKPVQQNQQRIAQRPVGDGCKIKVKRDSSGRVVGYEDNGKCEKNQIKSFTENINFDESEGEE